MVRLPLCSVIDSTFGRSGLAWTSASQETFQGGSAVIIISRLKGEGLVFGDDITLTVIDVRGDKVRFAVEMPEGGTADRVEGYEVLCRQDQERPMVVLETS